MNLGLKTNSTVSANTVAFDSVTDMPHQYLDGDSTSKPVFEPNSQRTKDPAEALAMHFRVDLDIFRGPLDLLLYLVRKHELDITDIAIAKITEQFIELMDVLEQLDVNMVGDFIEIAGILIETKSKFILPHPEEQQETLEDPGEELVEQLLEYKKYRDAASILDERSHDWQQRFPRLANDLPPREIPPENQPIHEVELWDLVNAFGRVLKTHEKSQPCSIVLDETPISVFMGRIHERLRNDGQIAFSDMFEPGMHKANLIGVFLAVLELVRHHQVHADQNDLYGEIYLLASEGFGDDLEVADVDDYFGGKESKAAESLSAKPR